jgi:hypothetical protein
MNGRPCSAAPDPLFGGKENEPFINWQGQIMEVIRCEK